ncbi:hypothetical protein GGF38_001285, partial [Coemansia sp. RSA 25]
TNCGFTDNVGSNGLTDTEEFFNLHKEVEDMLKERLLGEHPVIFWINKNDGENIIEDLRVYVNGRLKFTLPDGDLASDFSEHA